MKYELNDKLAIKLTEFQNETSFKSVDELIEFILQDYLDNHQADSDKVEDKKILEERLRNLGYL